MLSKIIAAFFVRLFAQIKPAGTRLTIALLLVATIVLFWFLMTAMEKQIAEYQEQNKHLQQTIQQLQSDNMAQADSCNQRFDRNTKERIAELQKIIDKQNDVKEQLKKIEP